MTRAQHVLGDRVLVVLDAAALRAWCEAGLEALRGARREIDELNVFPVPDGDTGTNLVLTMQAVAEALRQAATDGVDHLGATAKVMARGALMGARGNSGVILSQLLRGVSDALTGRPECTGADLQQALRRASDLGWAAVENPVEGTVLSVARAAADAAAEADPDSLVAVAVAAARGAAVALAETPRQLAVLRSAGVVDAGGRGLVVLLDSLAELVAGRGGTAAPGRVAPRAAGALTAARESGSDAFGYEVQFLLDADDAAVPPLRARLAALGDSLVVVGGDGLWNVHVHVNDVGAAIEAGIAAGRPHRIDVTRFADQYTALAQDTVLPQDAPATVRSGRAVVAVAPGDGLAELFAAEGAVVVGGGPTQNPSTAQILAAVLATEAAEVVLLPNDRTAHGVAVAAAQEARTAYGVVVSVLPTRSPLQGLAALAVADPAARFDDDVVRMSAAAGSTRWAEVTVAVRQAQTSAGVCEAGDVLGLLEGDVALIVAAGDGAVEEAARGLLDRLLMGGGELVTVVGGRDLPAGAAERLGEYVTRTRPVVEVVVYDGQQPHYPVLLSVE